MTLPDPPNILTLSSSLSRRSRSRQLCRCAHEHLADRPGKAAFIDLQDLRVLPYGMEGSEGLDRLEASLARADGILIGFPVYNFTMNASLKAVIERFGRGFEGKVVGLMMAAGGRSSYMSALTVITSLTFDYRSWMVPRFVYATKEHFEGDDNHLASPEIAERVRQLATTTYDTAWRLKVPLS